MKKFMEEVGVIQFEREGTHIIIFFEKKLMMVFMKACLCSKNPFREDYLYFKMTKLINLEMMFCKVS